MTHDDNGLPSPVRVPTPPRPVAVPAAPAPARPQLHKAQPEEEVPAPVRPAAPVPAAPVGEPIEDTPPQTQVDMPQASEPQEQPSVTPPTVISAVWPSPPPHLPEAEPSEVAGEHADTPSDLSDKPITAQKTRMADVVTESDPKPAPKEDDAELVIGAILFRRS